MRTTLLASIFTTIVTVAIVASASAADPVNIQIMAVEEQPGRMTLTVSAVDEKGKPFPGLGASSFNAWIDDKPLIIRGIQTDTSRLPASVLLLVDVSGSMAGEPMNQAKAAIQQFIDGLDPQDQVAVMSFSTNVQLLQDFTADHNALAHAVSQLTPVGETALYDGVIQAAQKMASAPAGRKLVVLLSDGTATIGVNNRAASIQNAQASGVGVVAFGLGTGIDRRYLNDLSVASGGRFLEASTPAALKQAYADLASAIRSQYTLQVEVPRSIDRTAPGRLKVHVIYRADNAFAERGLDALEGATPPPFSMVLDGLKPGDKPTGIVSLAPKVQEDIEVVKLDYYLDDNVIQTTDGSVAAYDLDASLLSSGSHVLKIVATDAAGREGEVQVPFIVPVVAASGGGASLPLLPLALLAALAITLYLGHKYFWKRIQNVVRGGDVYESRVSSWASIRTPGPVQRPEEWPERPAPMTAPGATEDAVRGRVVIMDEDAVRNGALDSIREFEMRSSPRTFGSGPGVDMRVGDAGGLIAAEEARVWVQRGRLVYHKLTTLSAMATEGVTAGWQFLEDGDEMRIGPYRLIFQAQIQEEVEVEVMPAPDRLPQEHGMALRPTGTENASSRGFSSWVSDTPSPGVEEAPRSPSLHDFDTPGQDDFARAWNAKVSEPAATSWGTEESTASEWTADAESAGSEGGVQEDASAVDAEEGDALGAGEAVRWGASEETMVSQWGVVAGEAATEVEPNDEPVVPETGAWSFADQSAASEWTSEPADESAASERSGEPAQGAAYEWKGNDHVAAGQWADSELDDAAPGDDSEPAAEPLQPGAWSTLAGGGGEEEPSWQGGDWDFDEEEGEEQKFWGR